MSLYCRYCATRLKAFRTKSAGICSYCWDDSDRRQRFQSIKSPILSLKPTLPSSIVQRPKIKLPTKSVNDSNCNSQIEWNTKWKAIKADSDAEWERIKADLDKKSAEVRAKTQKALDDLKNFKAEMTNINPNLNAPNMDESEVNKPQPNRETEPHLKHIDQTIKSTIDRADTAIKRFEEYCDEVERKLWNRS